MEKRSYYKCAAFCLTVFFLMVPDICVGNDGMEVLNHRFAIDTGPRFQSIARVEYNSIDNEFMVLWFTGGPLRDDCEPGDEYECTTNLYSIEARRVSPDGELLGDQIQLSPPEPHNKSVLDFAHNISSNEYMTFISWELLPPTPEDPEVEEVYMARINNVGDVLSGPEPIYPAGGGENQLPMVVFNPEKTEYFVVYTDRNIFNPDMNTVGFILDGDGNAIHGPFPVGTQMGDFFAPRGVYNKVNDTYFVVWEDFRHVDNWRVDPGDVYGAILDSDGNMIADVTVLDDYGMPGEGNQRVPVAAYNPDKNEYLVIYKDEPKAPLTETAGYIMGRIVDADGNLSGDAFLIEDHPNIQHYPDIEYIEDEKKYFMVWDDFRDSTTPIGYPFYLCDDQDVYGRWLDDSGMPIGDEIVIADSEGWQMNPYIAYNPLMKRFLTVWWDRDVVDDYEDPDPGGHGPFSNLAADIRGTIYGARSFVSSRVIAKGTGDPVEGARVIFIGPGLFEMETTNVGGWCNLVEDSQRDGRYFMIAWKRGHGMAMQSIRYEGESLQTTIELR